MYNIQYLQYNNFDFSGYKIHNIKWGVSMKNKKVLQNEEIIFNFDLIQKFTAEILACVLGALNSKIKKEVPGFKNITFDEKLSINLIISINEKILSFIYEIVNEVAQEISSEHLKQSKPNSSE